MVHFSFFFFSILHFPFFPQAVMSCEAATQTEVGPGTAVVSRHETEHPVVTLRRGRGHRRPRPSSMVDYQSYRDTKLLVARFLQQQSPCSLTPEVQELINSIKSVLRTDQEHMEEAVRCATFIQQVKHTILPPKCYYTITALTHDCKMVFRAGPVKHKQGVNFVTMQPHMR